MENFDVIVIGSGPGGYVAAIRCAQLGHKTAIVERYSTLGGTCLNVGCIPSKALLDSTEHYHNALKHFSKHGIEAEQLSVNWTKMRQRKAGVVSQTCDGIRFLMKKNKIQVFEGTASFESKHESGKKLVKVSPAEGEVVQLTAPHVIVATGSKPSSLPGVTLDKKRIITSTEALQLEEIPKSLTVIGGGVIGLELGSVYARLGTEVTVVEFMSRLLPQMDESIGKEIQRLLKKQLSMRFHLGHAVQKAHVEDGQVIVTAKNKSGKEVRFSGEYCLVSIGRKPYTEGLALERIGIELNQRGQIPVNEHLETSVPGVYAIGDVIQGAMLAHKAEEEGVFVAETISGQKPHINYNAIPGVLYTWPEAAGVGLTEQELKASQRKYKVGNFPFRALGRARAALELDGFVKILADQDTDEILGVHMVGARVADMIAEAVVALEYRASAEDLARMSHAHPTFTEAIKEAALDATEKRPLHL